MTTLPAATPATFVKQAPLWNARRLADADLKQTITPAELSWLHANPLLWLRALVAIRTDIEAHITKDRLSLAALKPPSGTNPSPEYLAAKHESARRTVSRMHVHSRVVNRLAEVKSIYGEELKNLLPLGDVIVAFTTIADLLKVDDLDQAAAIAEAWIKKLDALNHPH